MTKMNHSRLLSYLPGGVNSPVRAFPDVDVDPIWFHRGQGAFVYNESDKPYIDYVCAWGSMIVGHANPVVGSQIKSVVDKGFGFGATHPSEADFAATMLGKVCPYHEKIRVVNSGTEACMSAIRLARGVTTRTKVIKFDGCYHGHSDSMLVKGGSGMLALSQPSSLGVPKSMVEDVHILPYNSVSDLAKIFSRFENEIACVILEPVAGNMNCIPSSKDFLRAVRDLCTKHGTLLIFDEVMSGSRVHPHSSCGLYGITPDISTFGKVVGGGLPIGLIASSASYMDHFAPCGQVYQAGTFSGNPMTMTAGLATLDILYDNDAKELKQLNELGQYFAESIERSAQQAGVPCFVNQRGGMLGVFIHPYSASEVLNIDQIRLQPDEWFRMFFKLMLDEGISIPPSPYESWFISTAHDKSIIDQTIQACDVVFSKMAKEIDFSKY